MCQLVLPYRWMIKKQEDHSGPVSLPWDTIANYMGMAAILTFKS